MTGSGGSLPAKEQLIEYIRVAAHAAVDAGDGAAAIELTRLLEERCPTAAAGAPAVLSLDEARARRRRRGK
jgi:hypothetical protein